MTTEITMGVIDAANFVSSAVLISLGIIIIVATILVINNLFSRYWRPVKVFTYIAAKISAEDAAIMEENRVERIEPRAESKKPMQPQVIK
jgi:hypothetical protein